MQVHVSREAQLAQTTLCGCLRKVTGAGQVSLLPTSATSGFAIGTGIPRVKQEVP
jgi:hypothetical protein